jgi:hypothetical protein
MAKSLEASVGGDVDETPLRAMWRALERWKDRRALRIARWAADAELARRDAPPLRLAWRVEELVSTKNRLDLAHSLRSLVHDAGPRYLASASPVNRLAVRAESDTLLALASRLLDLKRPVGARGVVLLERLLVEPSGPLYDRELADDLPPYLDCTLKALEPR